MSAAWLLLLVFPALAFGQENPLEQGVALFRQGQYQAALTQFENARRAQPGNATIENLMGIAETKLGHIEQATAHYRNAIRLNPELETAHKNLGFNYLNGHQYTEAEAELESAVKLNADDPFPHYYLAIAWLKTGKDADAIAQLQPAESLIENDPETAFLMAIACLHAKLTDAGLRIIDAVGQRSAFSPEQEFQLAAALSAKRMFPASLQLFEHLQKEQPASWVASYNLAVALVDANRAAEAIPLLEPLAAQRPKDGRILDLLGSLYESQGKMPAALGAYQKAVAADPENSDYYLDYTRLLMDLDRYDDAASLIEKGIHNVQDDYGLDVRLGAIDLMQGETEPARVCFKKAIHERPELAVGYVALAKTYMEEGQDQIAANVLADARNKVGRDFALEYVYGLVLAQLGKTAEALDALKTAESLGPNITEPHYQIAKIDIEEKRWAEAETELERVLALNPSHAQACYQLSRVYASMGETEKARAMQAQANRLINAQRNAALNAERARLGAFHSQ